MGEEISPLRRIRHPSWDRVGGDHRDSVCVVDRGLFRGPVVGDHLERTCGWAAGVAVRGGCVGNFSVDRSGDDDFSVGCACRMDRQEKKVADSVSDTIKPVDRDDHRNLDLRGFSLVGRMATDKDRLDREWSESLPFLSDPARNLLVDRTKRSLASVQLALAETAGKNLAERPFDRSAVKNQLPMDRIT